MTTLAEDGLMAVFKMIPSYYLLGAGALALGGLLIYGKIWFHNKVEAEAQKVINTYITAKKKDDQELSAITLKDDTKIQIQYLDRVKVVTKVVHDNAAVIKNNVPDIDTILSNGWVSSFNSVVKGATADPITASIKTPSGVSAVDALTVDNINYGTCLLYKERADAWFVWYTTQSETIAKQNKKDDKK